MLVWGTIIRTLWNIHDGALNFNYFCKKIQCKCLLEALGCFRFKKQPQEVFCRKGCSLNFAKVTRKLLCRSLFFNKVAGLVSFYNPWKIPVIRKIFKNTTGRQLCSLPLLKILGRSFKFMRENLFQQSLIF